MRTKNKISCLIAIAAFTLVFSSCKKDDMVVTDPQLENLFGKWVWVQSSGGFAGMTFTPASTGYTQYIEFNKDGSYKLYKNNTEQDNLSFVLSSGTSIYTGKTAYMVSFIDKGILGNNNMLFTESFRFGGTDSLFISEECYDCYSHIYIKQK